MARKMTGVQPAALLGVVLAMNAEAAEIANPQWQTQPTPEAFLAAYPKEAGAGSVVLGCNLRVDGSMSDCVVRNETPEGKGFAAAALKLAPLYRMAMPPQGYTQKDVDEGLTVPLNIVWRPSVLATPEWLTAPNWRDIAVAFPGRAMRQGVQGGAKITCTVTTQGTLEKCTVTEEYPSGYGFGVAALSLADKFRMKPQTKDGAYVGGAKVQVPIIFAIQ